MTTDTRAPARFAGLDGLRAVAVLLVVGYHVLPALPLAGGFVGVDVFFVLSGFLITALLLRERDRTGRIDLVAFWRRRARRLLPALVLVVTVCATAALFVGGDLLVRLGDQVLGAATFSYNWVAIAGGGGYFSDAAPELFRNVWSLAVEEQFYLLWPLVLPLFLLLPRVAYRVAAATALALASAGWMAVLASGSTDATRAYFGTDSHAFGILLGVALAFLLRRALESPPEWMLRPRARSLSSLAGALALAGLVAVAMVPAIGGAATFPGALGAASALTGIALVACVWPGSRLGPALDVRPLRWVGDRSYGIYLWHWPVLVLVAAATRAPVGQLPLGAVVVAATVAAASASYRFIEMPVRRRGFRASLRALGCRLTGTPTARFRALGVIAVALAMLGGTSAAIAAAPDVSSGEAAVEAGIAALADAEASPSASEPAPTETDRGAGAPEGVAPVGPSSDAETAPPPAEGAPATPSPEPTPVAGDEITAVGDSVMLASAPGLLERLPGIQIDAAVSRSSWAGPGILQSLADAGALRHYVVLALGTNGPVDHGSLERMAAIAGPDRELVLVNAFAPRDWIPGVNGDLAAFAASHPNVVVADWSTAIAPHADLLAGDGIHPGQAGGRIFADAVAAAIDGVEAARAQRQFDAEQWARALLDDRMRPRSVE